MRTAKVYVHQSIQADCEYGVLNLIYTMLDINLYAKIRITLEPTMCDMVDKYMKQEYYFQEENLRWKK